MIEGSEDQDIMIKEMISLLAIEIIYRACNKDFFFENLSPKEPTGHREVLLFYDFCTTVFFLYRLGF